LRGFLCENGARFYGIPINNPDGTYHHSTSLVIIPFTLGVIVMIEKAITLVNREWTVPLTYELVNEANNTSDLIVPLRAGETMPWSLSLSPKT
jgi:dihydroorotase